MKQRVEPKELVSQSESSIQWASHQELHDVINKGINNQIDGVNQRIDDLVTAHERVHSIHAEAHDREHELNELAITKAENQVDRRLEGMNEFRDQLNKQAQTFVTRDIFDKYTSDMEAKIEIALASLSDKDEALIRSAINRHDSDFNSLRDLIQAEREVRKAFEGSINTWKWLAGFLGASGVAGVILLFATK